MYTSCTYNPQARGSRGGPWRLAVIIAGSNDCVGEGASAETALQVHVNSVKS